MDLRDAKGVNVPGSNVPGFLAKLWLLVKDASTDELIGWGPFGNSFVVQNQTRFAKEILPKFFKHSNMASFIRQLNMYGFRKKAHLDQGSLRTDTDEIEFQHQNFQKEKPELLENIKRKVSAREEGKLKMEDVHRILTDVQDMKGKQDNISGTLESIQRENQVLWREVVYLRQRHEKQQKIVNRLIQFLITMVKPVGLKRKQQLMIEPALDQSKPKYSRLGNSDETLPIQPPVSFDTDLDTLPNISTFSEVASVADVTDTPATTGQPSTTPGVEADMAAVSDPAPATLDPSLFLLDIPPVSPDTTAGVVSPIVTSPASIEPISATLSPPSSAIASEFDSVVWPVPETDSQIKEDMIAFLGKDDTNQFDDAGGSGLGLSSGEIPEETFGATFSPASKAIMKRSLSHQEQRGELGEHVNTVQENLDLIQHMLTSLGGTGTYNLDINSLMEIFSSDNSGNTNDMDLFPILADTNFENPNDQNTDNQESVKGTEVVQYISPATSPATSPFTMEDEDSLLKSLDDDAAALSRPYPFSINRLKN